MIAIRIDCRSLMSYILKTIDFTLKTIDFTIHRLHGAMRCVRWAIALAGDCQTLYNTQDDAVPGDCGADGHMVPKRFKEKFDA